MTKQKMSLQSGGMWLGLHFKFNEFPSETETERLGLAWMSLLLFTSLYLFQSMQKALTRTSMAPLEKK